ncbi:hypothetical protein [Bradyrhizobium sp. USDA 3315]
MVVGILHDILQFLRANVLALAATANLKGNASCSNLGAVGDAIGGRAQGDRDSANQRRVDVARLPKLSSDSVQLDAFARTLICSADQSQRICVEAAASSQEASENGRMSRTDKLAAAIAEVGWQVEKVPNMAQLAVRKAKNSAITCG